MIKPPASLLALLISAALSSCSSSAPSSNTSNSAIASPEFTVQSSHQPGQQPTPASLPPAYDPLNDRSEEGIRQNIEDTNKSITYAHLKKNAERYHGEPWSFTGKIQQIFESDGKTTALISLDDWGSKPIWVRANFTTEFIENNRVFVVGYLSGNYSYTSIAGWNMTVPALDARAMLKPNEVAKYRSIKKTR
jgi:hypothetical protein